MAKGVMLKVGGAAPSDLTATPDKVIHGKKFVGSAKTLETGSIPKVTARTITPATYDQTIASGNYIEGTQLIAGDANLIASNIRAGVTIFGITGTA